jgi:hypothetical protein
VAAQLVASQVVLSSTESVSQPASLSVCHTKCGSSYNKAPDQTKLRENFILIKNGSKFFQFKYSFHSVYEFFFSSEHISVALFLLNNKDLVFM